MTDFSNEAFRILNGSYFYCGAMIASMCRIMENKACVEALLECGVDYGDLAGLVKGLRKLGETAYSQPSPTDFLLAANE